MKNFNFNSMTDAELFIHAGLMVNHTKNNVFSATCKQKIDVLNGAYSVFCAALIAEQKKSKDCLPKGDTRRFDLLTALSEVRQNIEKFIVEHWITDTSNRFFDAYPPLMPSTIIGMPTHFIAYNAARKGSVDLFWEPVASAIMYIVHYRLQGETLWQQAGHTTNCALFLPGFQVGTYVEFRLCALGQGELKSTWTPIIGIWVA